MATTLINDYEVMYSAKYFSAEDMVVERGEVYRAAYLPSGWNGTASGWVVGWAGEFAVHLADFQNCAAILRNEKTVYLLYNGSGFENGLMTSQEAPGS